MINIYEKAHNLWQTLNAVKLLTSSDKPLDDETKKAVNLALKENRPTLKEIELIDNLKECFNEHNTPAQKYNA